MATKKKRKPTPPRRKASRSPRRSSVAQPKPMPGSEGSGMRVWPLVLLALIGIGIYFSMRKPALPETGEAGPARKVAPAQPAGAEAAPAKVDGAVTRPAAPEGNIAGESVMVWDRSAEAKVTFKVMRGEGESAEVRIFGPKNKLAKLLRSEAGKRGWVSLVWDGLNEKGQKVASGTYFARISREGGDVIQELRVL